MDINKMLHNDNDVTEQRQDESKVENISVSETMNSSPDKKKVPDYCRTLVVKDHHGVVKELVFPKALDLDRPKRARTTFSAEQLYSLENEFQRNQYLVGRERTQLAQNLGLSETQVKVWFQNRRTKFKRDKGKEDDERSSKSETVATCNLFRMLGNPSNNVVTSPSPTLPTAAAPSHVSNIPVNPLPVNSLPLPFPPGPHGPLYHPFSPYQHHYQMSQHGNA